MDIKTDLDPVGKSLTVPGFDFLVERMKQVWGEIKANADKFNYAGAVSFLSHCLDTLIVYLVEHHIPGEDKKATVMKAITDIYDNVVVGLFPILLRPFSKVIKRFVINILISHAIDRIVSKYNTGSWSPQATTQILAIWGVPQQDPRP
jgi:hypothetical protein